MINLNNKRIILALEILALLVLGIIFFLPSEIKAYTTRIIYPDGYEEIFETSTKDYDSSNSNSKRNNPQPSIYALSPSSIESVSNNKLTITVKGGGFVEGSVVRKNNSSRPTTFIDSNHLLVDIYPNDMYNSDGFYLTVYNKQPGGGTSNGFYFTIEDNTPAPTSYNNTRTNNYSNNTNYDSGSSRNENTSYYNSNSRNYTASTANINRNSYSYSSDSEDPYNEEYDSVYSSRNNTFGTLAANAFYGSKNSFLPSGILQWIIFFLLLAGIVILFRYLFSSRRKFLLTPLKHA